MKRRKLRLFIYFISIFAALLTLNLSCIYPLQAIQSGDGIALFIIDNSGSMGKVLNEEIKLNTAKKVVKKVVENSSLDAINMGLIKLGGQCEVKELVEPNLNNREKIIRNIDRVQTPPHLNASTPIAEALYDASDIIEKHRFNHGEVPARVILISDGEANCMAEHEMPVRPCDMLTKLREKNIQFDLTLINYGITSKKDEELECIAELSDNTIMLNPDNITNISTIIENDINETISKDKNSPKTPPQSKTSPQHQPPKKPKNPFHDLLGPIGQLLAGLAAIITAIWGIVTFFLKKHNHSNSNQDNYYY